MLLIRYIVLHINAKNILISMLSYLNTFYVTYKYISNRRVTQFFTPKYTLCLHINSWLDLGPFGYTVLTVSLRLSPLFSCVCVSVKILSILTKKKKKNTLDWIAALLHGPTKCTTCVYKCWNPIKSLHINRMWIWV